jgi:outer membrane protein OmpA-like peptidoglycan-associated protein
MVTLRAVATGVLLFGAVSLSTSTVAQERLPMDSSAGEYGEYHPSPAYRESESHPLRVLAYIVHPIGWLAREVIFRPLSYFASSTPETRAIMGYREPHDFRKPSCFSQSDAIPDCRDVKPFDYEGDEGGFDEEADESVEKKKNIVYFPDVNFDFNKRALNSVGKSKAERIAAMVRDGEPVNVELQGHADKRGSETYNQKLGLDRAEAVKAELVRLGVPEEHLFAVSFGERRPLFPENEDWAHAANRRVEVYLAGKKVLPLAGKKPASQN